MAEGGETDGISINSKMVDSMPAMSIVIASVNKM